MYINTLYEKKSGRTKLKIVEGYRKDGKVKQRMVKDLGYLDELEKQFDNPIAHFKTVAKQMTAEKKRLNDPVAVMVPVNSTLSMKDTNAPKSQTRKNIGYAALSKFYHQLEIDYFLNNRRRYKKFEANLNSIFKMLVFNRILYPSSKKTAWENRGRFFQNDNYSLEDVYRSLDYFLEWRPALLKHLHKRVQTHYKRDTLLLYYDVTNYYFEIDQPDDLRKKGVSKEHRPNPIVQMGLFMDEQGIPVSYNLYQGNMNDSTTLPSMIDDTVVGFDMHNLIVVADKGMMSGDNIANIRLKHNGYVFSYSVRGADKAFKDYVLNEKDYTEHFDCEGNLVSKHKGRITPREIWVTTSEGKRKKSIVNERQVVIYSEAYAKRARIEREKAIEKAKGKIWSLSKDGKAASFGAAKYIKKVPLNRETGECNLDSDFVTFLDEERIALEEKLDGYYVICTNVIGLSPRQKSFKGRCRYTKDGFLQLNRQVSDDDIIGMYKGLWRIEETFKVTKSDLKTRPVYLSTHTHIRAHFLICFVSLLLMRLLEFQLDWNHSASAIQQSLASACGTAFEDNLYIFDYYDKLLAKIGDKLALDFSRKYMSAQEIRSLLASAKKN